MSEIRFGALQDSLINRTAYKVGTKLFALPGQVGAATDRFVAAHPKGLLGKVAQGFGDFTQKFVVNQEYQQVTDIKLGKRKLFTAPRPPMGAMMLWLYPGTILPRALRGYERGKENGGDYREVFDVLRRDLMAITIFVFMLDPLVEKLNKLKQKFDGLEIVDRGKRKDALLTYRQFDHYKLVNKQVLIRLLEEGNGKGLLKAVREMLHERGLEKQVGSTALSKHVTALKQMIPDLIAAHERGDLAAREKLAGYIIQHVKAADALTEEAYEKAKLGGTPKMVKQLEKLRGSFEGIVKQYAKTRRLPADVLAFGIVVAALGWFPVWLNSLWNRKRFQEKMAAENKRPVAPPVIDPRMTFQAFPQANPFQPAQSFAAPAANPFFAKQP